MQCPECNHIPLAGNQPDPERCPNCGIYYAKAIELRKQKVAPPAPSASVLAPHVKKIASDNRGAQQVVVVDVHMSFSAMVWFMVKWAVAAIPALVILIFIAFFLVLFLAGVVGFSK